MKVAAYVRVSSLEQFEHGFSIRAQEDKLLPFAESQDWEVVKVYREEGKSAKDMERPALQQMLADMKNSTFDVVLVHKLDRLTRSVLDANKILQELEQYSVSFKSATEPYDTTTAQGKMFLNIMASLAQFEREQLAERVRFGMTQSAKEGKWSGGIIPLGYDYKDGVFQINEEEAKLVKKIFDLTKSTGFHNVAKELNAQGYKTKSGTKFSHTSIKYIVRNPFYIGKVRFNDNRTDRNKLPLDQQKLYNSDHPTFIDEQEFWNLQRELKKRSDNNISKHKTNYIFTGPLRCARCGSKMSGNMQHSTKSKIYRCNKKSTTVNGRCDMPQIREESIEKKILEQLDPLVNEYYANVEIEKNKVDNSAVEKELKQIQKRMDKYKTMFVNDLIGIDELNENVYALREKEKELQQQLQPQQNSVDQDTLHLINNLNALWSEANEQEKKELIGSLFTSIYVNADPSFVPGPFRQRPITIEKVEL